MIEKYNKVDHSIFWDLQDENQLSIFIIGHLAIESVIVQLIELKLPYPEKLDVTRLNFPGKIQLCLALDIFDEQIGDLLIAINSKRNKYAHRLKYKMTFDEVYELIKLAARSGVDFSDNLEKSKDFALSVHDTRSLLLELMSNTFFELACDLHELGGEFLLG